MKKILIFYASYGGGHYSAAKAVKDYIDENYKDVETSIADCMKFISRPLEGLTTAAYREIAKIAPEFYGKIYINSEKGPLFELSKEGGELLAIKLNRLIQAENPDIIISTHHLSSQMCSYLKKKKHFSCILATVITDFGVHNQWLVGHEYTDYFFIADAGMKKEMACYGVDEGKIYITGIPVSSRFFKKYDRKKICGCFGLDPNKNVMLFFGGGEFGLGKGATVRILKVFAENLKDYQIVAVAGKNESMKKKFEELARTAGFSDGIKVLGFTDKVPELMSVASFVVSKPGGITSAEAMASGLPMIIINPIPGQEEKNAEYLEKNNVGLWLKAAGTEEEIKDFIFSSKEKFREIRRNVMKLRRQNSSGNLCKIILK